MVIDENKPLRERKEFMHPRYTRARNNNRKALRHRLNPARKRNQNRRFERIF